MTAKRFQCRYCDAQFNRSEHFKRHERSHTGEKPFTCVICGMSFVRNDLMLRHGRLKHKTNLRKPSQLLPPPLPPPQFEQVEPTSPSSSGLQTLVSVVPDQFESAQMDFDACFSAIDPALYAPWPIPENPVPQTMICSDLQTPVFNFPNPQQLLLENGFRDVLIKAAQAMSQPPKIPSSSSLNRYVSLFVKQCLPHNPFLPPSFKIELANPLLLICMASLGALYGVERKTALMLHTVGKNLEENLRSALGCEDYPLWAVQSLYLNSMFASSSGFAKGVQWAISHMPILAILCRGIHRKVLTYGNWPDTYDEWIEVESFRRTYFCIYIFSGGLTLLFATPPVVTTADARGLLLPSSTDEWTSEVDPRDWTPPSSTLYDDAMMALWSGTPSDCSEFGIRILANSIFLEIWQAKHGHGPWLPEDWKERHYIVLQTFQSHIRHEDIHSDECDPLVRNADYILYGCYYSLANDTTFLEEAFCHSSQTAICNALKLTYSQFDAKVDVRSIRAGFNAYGGAVSKGLKFISHTGCWNNGLECAYGGFFAGILLIHWVRRMEELQNLTPEEAQLMAELRKLMEEGDVQIYPESLAASLARSCIQLMDQVYIYGITPFMGDAFRLYAEEILGSRAAIMDIEPVLLEDEQRSEYGD